MQHLCTAASVLAASHDPASPFLIFVDTYSRSSHALGAVWKGSTGARTPPTRWAKEPKGPCDVCLVGALVLLRRCAPRFALLVPSPNAKQQGYFRIPGRLRHGTLD